MVTPREYVEQVVDRWDEGTCPFCNDSVGVTRFRIMSSYVFLCNSCGEVVEAFELYQDDQGCLYTEHHERAVRDADQPIGGHLAPIAT